MWKTFQSNGQLYMIKLIQHENIEVFLTDLKNIWTENISKDALLKQFQEMNPLFDIKIDEAVDEVTELVHQISDIGIEISHTSDTLELILKSVKSEFNMEYKFKFVQASIDTFLKEVTVPLIQTVKHLEEQQKMLCAVIQKKDRELEEYKLEKGQISREDLITDKFDEAVLGKVDNKSMMNVFGSSKSFWESFVEQHGNIAATIEDVKTDPWNHIKRKKKVYSSKTVTKKDPSRENLPKEITEFMESSESSDACLNLSSKKLEEKFEVCLEAKRSEIHDLTIEVCNSNGATSKDIKEGFKEEESCVDSSKESSDGEQGFAVMESCGEESFEEEGHLKDEGKPDLQNEKKQCDGKQTAITKEDLQKEIVTILKTADLSKISVKIVREMLEAKFQTSFHDRRLEIDCLVKEWLNSTPVDKKKAITKEDLRKEIVAILKTADLSKTSVKMVREMLEAKFQTSFHDRRLEIDCLVMEWLNSTPVDKKKAVTITNEDLRKEIFSMLKTADSSKTTLKIVRETLEAKFQTSLEDRKLEIRYLVMEYQYLNSPVDKNPNNMNHNEGQGNQN